MRLTSSASQPHLSLAARHARSTPVAASSRAYDPRCSDPTRGRTAACAASQRGVGAPPQRLSRSSSAVTIGSITEEPEPYSAEAAEAWCAAPAPSAGCWYGGATASRSSCSSSCGGGCACFSSSASGGAARPPPGAAPRRAGDEPGANSRVDALLIQHAGGRAAPPAWVVRAMRALEASYERQLSDAREAVVAAEEVARSAAAGIVAIDGDVARRGDFAASSVARASAASEAAARRQVCGTPRYSLPHPCPPTAALMQPRPR